jgi:hypothetical protein
MAPFPFLHQVEIAQFVALGSISWTVTEFSRRGKLNRPAGSRCQCKRFDWSLGEAPRGKGSTGAQKKKGKFAATQETRTWFCVPRRAVGGWRFPELGFSQKKSRNIKGRDSRFEVMDV